VQRDHPCLGAESEERQQERQRGPWCLQICGAQRRKGVIARAAVHDAKAQKDRDCPEVRHKQIQEPGAAHGRQLVVGDHQEVRRQRHRLPGHHEQIGVVGQDHERHAGEEDVVVQADERQTVRRLFAEITGGVDRDAGRYRPEQEQEEPGQRIDSQVERQLRQAERQRHALRRKPDGLQAEGGEHQPCQGAQRKRDLPGEQRVAGGNQSHNRDGYPGDRDEKRAGERGERDLHCQSEPPVAHRETIRQPLIREALSCLPL
jgi:hypothetical protein